MIVDGEFGWWCESDGVKDFENVVNEIIDDQLEINSKGQNAREYLEVHYTVEKNYEIIMSHLK